MYLALHLPALPLEAQLRHHPEKRFHPHAVLSSPVDHRASSVSHGNRAAARQGVLPGLSPTRALARCPDLRFLERDPDAEASVLRALLQLAESLTPDFELTTPDTLLLDLHRSAGLQAASSPRREAPLIPTAHGSRLTWNSREAGRSWHSRLSALGLPLQLATADTPDLAHLFSLHPATSHVLLYRGPHFRWKAPTPTADPLTDLPLAILRHLASDLAPWECFHQWGIRTLADLAKLPRQGLAERLGPEAARIHDLLHGKTRRLLRLFQPAESIASEISLEHPVEHSEALVLLLKRSLQTLCARLASHYRAAAEIELDLETSPPHHHRIRLPEPSALPATLLRPLATHLETLQLPAPVSGFQLTLVPCAPHAGQHPLFDRGIRHPHRLADTLVRLSALLGDDRLGFPVPAFTHRPDTFHLQPAHHLFERTADCEIGTPSSRGAAAQTPTAHGSLGTRYSAEGGPPLYRFRPPIPIAVAFEKARPHPIPLALLTGPHRGRITDRRGPFPLSGHWWDPAAQWQQLEWDILLETRHLLRLAHTPPDQWLLHGAYP